MAGASARVFNPNQYENEVVCDNVSISFVLILEPSGLHRVSDFPIESRGA